jgi:hypothetical protein
VTKTLIILAPAKLAQSASDLDKEVVAQQQMLIDHYAERQG